MGPVPARSYDAPESWVARGGTWPDGPFRAGAPRYVLLTAAIASALVGALQSDGRSIRAVARDAGIAHPSITRLLHGQSVPDSVTITQLEATLGVDLWPHRTTLPDN